MLSKWLLIGPVFASKDIFVAGLQLALYRLPVAGETNHSTGFGPSRRLSYNKKVILVPKIIKTIVHLYIPMSICLLYSPLYKEFETISVLLSRLEARAVIKVRVSVKTNFLELISTPFKVVKQSVIVIRAGKRPGNRHRQHHGETALSHSYK